MTTPETALGNALTAIGNMERELRHLRYALESIMEQEHPDLPIDTLPIDYHTIKELQSHGIHTVPQLCQLKITELFSWQGIGRKRVNDIKAALEGLGLGLLRE